MKFILFISFLFLIPFVNAETTFFDQDDAFVMGDSTLGEVIGGSTGRGGCTYKWNCATWSECLPSGEQTRTCTNLGTCPDTYKKPETQRDCTYVSPLPEEILPAQEIPETIPEEKSIPQPTQPIIPLSFNILVILTLFVITLVIVYDLKIKKRK